ncbi:MAG: hypothetical protein PHX01_04480 [Clostridia bacterium]|nr:hypothetical protein [Clostridia bacterium]
MGLFSEVKKFGSLFMTIDRALRGQDIFNKKVNKMLKPYKLNWRKKREVNEKLQDLRRLVLIEAMERETGLAPSFKQERDELLKKHAAPNGSEAIVSIAGEINNRYNARDTDDAKWVDLKVQFFEYSAKNYQELTELKKLASEAQRLHANSLVQRAKEAYQKLVTEENNLYEMVESSRPENYKAAWKEVSYNDDYNLTARIIKYKTSLYKKQGRTTLLWAYNQHVKDCGGDPQRIEKGILSADKYWGKAEETQSALENLTKSAQELREPQAVKSEQVLESDKVR